MLTQSHLPNFLFAVKRNMSSGAHPLSGMLNKASSFRVLLVNDLFEVNGHFKPTERMNSNVECTNQVDWESATDGERELAQGRPHRPMPAAWPNSTLTVTHTADLVSGLFDIAQSGDTAAFQRLLTSSSGTMPLPINTAHSFQPQGCKAASVSHPTPSQCLLLTSSPQEMTMLGIACAQGHTELITLLLAVPGVDVNWQDDEDQWSALMWACHQGHAGAVEALLTAVDVNLINEVTPLYPSCVSSPLISTLEWEDSADSSCICWTHCCCGGASG